MIIYAAKMKNIMATKSILEEILSKILNSSRILLAFKKLNI
jgi:hypothetical protein